MPCAHRWRNKGTFNLSPINNVQLRRPFCYGSPVKVGALLWCSNGLWLVYHLRICALSHVWQHQFIYCCRATSLWSLRALLSSLDSLEAAVQALEKYVKRKIRRMPLFLIYHHVIYTLSVKKKEKKRKEKKYYASSRSWTVNKIWHFESLFIYYKKNAQKIVW